jgi:isoleucyl-tRNA synthetase
LKVRQPLSKVLVNVSKGSAEISEELVEIVIDELNIKAMEFVDDVDELVDYKVLPNNKLLGPKFGADFPKVRAALSGLDPAEVAATVAEGEAVTFELNGETVSLSGEEILVNTEAVEGMAVAADKVVTVAIDTLLTPELIAEGLAREIVRRIQAQRKNAGLNIEDRIKTWYVAPDELDRVFKDWSEYIQTETLTTELVAGEPPADAFVEKHKVEGQECTLGVKKSK